MKLREFDEFIALAYFNFVFPDYVYSNKKTKKKNNKKIQTMVTNDLIN